MPDESGSPTFQEVIAKLRARLLDAKKLGVGEEEPQDFTLGMMMQLMNECERQRQVCLRDEQSHREQARAAQYQASAFGMVHSMAWSVYDGFVKAQEKAIEEEKKREEEKKKEAEEAELEAKTAPKPEVKPEPAKAPSKK